MAVTSNILQRTFNIRCGSDDNVGTCFTADVDNKRYLITARHIAQGLSGAGIVELMYKDQWTPVPVRVVGHGQDGVDVSVLAPSYLFGAPHALMLSTAHLMLAEEVYFLGFPFGLGFDGGKLNEGMPFPLVKRAIMSAMDFQNGIILLDGHNNPGFSGGPVVRSSRSTGPHPQTVIGVVSGYRYSRQHVLDPKGNRTQYTYDTNTGIVVAVDIRHVNDMITANPIGIKST